MIATQTHAGQSLKLDLIGSKSAKSSDMPKSSKKTTRWEHTAKSSTLAWLLFSIPLIFWDTGFVLLRPLSMPGGWLHEPIWKPYELYMRTDYVYGWKAVIENNGFTAAQSTMNIPETVLYMVYLYLAYAHGTEVKAPSTGSSRWFLSRRNIAGQYGALAVLVGLMGAVMTCSKTILYGLNEVFSGFSNVGHNSLLHLIFLYIIPNGAWLVASALMTVEFSREVMQGLSAAGEDENAAKQD